MAVSGGIEKRQNEITTGAMDSLRGGGQALPVVWDKWPNLNGVSLSPGRAKIRPLSRRKNKRRAIMRAP